LSYAELADVIARKFSIVAILRDFDEEGKLAHETISRLLEEKQIEMCHDCREKLETLLKEEEIATIEGIYRLIAKPPLS